MNSVVQATAITKSFRTLAGELTVLKGIDLTVSEGEMIAIMGASGAGKSTLLHILGTLDRPTSGTIHFQGEDVFRRTDTGLAGFRNRSIGFVFQFHHLLPEFNAVENVMLPGLVSGRPHDELKAAASSLLADLGVVGRDLHRPGELSGGEQQRVAVARALIQNPQLVLADEPTGNLDTKTGDALFELFLDLNKTKGITFVVVTHNRTLADRCTRILEMADGRFLA